MKVLENTAVKQHPLQGKVAAPDESQPLKGETLNSQECNDLTLLSPLNAETVLQVIESRYHGGIFYSWAGVPLVALNPFRNVTELYDDEVVEKYKRGSSCLAKELPPHIFAVGQKAFVDLKRDLETRNQSIIVSGESGAGKTWTTRNLMHFIIDITNTRTEKDSQVSRIEQRILNSNPILEAFGNATTVRNENSSRFGKYIQLQFDRTHMVVGATINTYLLEKTRVAHQAEGEKRFHIFEQITSAGYREFDASDNSYSSQALEATRRAMRNIGIGNEVQSEIFEVLSGILSLCDVHFTSPTKMPDETCIFQDFRNVSKACESLGTGVEALKQCLALRRIITGSTGEQFMKPCSASECTERRDCMAKLIYSRLFDWIVDFINTSIKAPTDSGYSFIGLLDIYGFENFEVNSLEQLCINYANEKLQQHFVHYFMKRQQEEYRKEGIDWSFQDYVDNRPCLDLIEGKLSIFSLINEECRLKRDLDTKSFGTRLETSFVENSHFDVPRFSSRSADHEFRVYHFAGSVCYRVEGLLKKNKDLVPPEVVELLQSSKHPLIQRLFGVRIGEVRNGVKVQNGDCTLKDAGKHRRATVTVVSKFKASLDSLMSTLRSTNVHYIRCIKPNSKCKPGVFDRKEVLAQLNACGVVETIRISAAGFPIRLSHLEFLRRYSLVLKHFAPVTPTDKTNFPASSPFKSPGSPRAITVDRRKHSSRRVRRTCYDHTKFICRSILEAVHCYNAEGKENLASTECEGVKIGRTKIFFQEEEMEKLELARNRCLSESVLRIQKCWGRHRRRRERKRTAAAIAIQSVWRGSFAKKRFQTARRAAIIIQQHTRHYFTAKRQRERLPKKTDRQLTIQKVSSCRCSPTLRPLTESTTNDLIRRFAIRPFGSWFDLIGTGIKALRPTISFYARYDSKATFNPAERNRSTLELVCFSKHPRESETTDSSNKRSSGYRQFVNRSSSVVSRREIEKVPVTFHCQGTPLPYANRRPTRGCTTNMGLADIREMDYDHLQSDAELD